MSMRLLTAFPVIPYAGAFLQPQGTTVLSAVAGTEAAVSSCHLVHALPETLALKLSGASMLLRVQTAPQTLFQERHRYQVAKLGAVGRACLSHIVQEMRNVVGDRATRYGKSSIYGVEDLLQEGSMGVLRAVDLYNPHSGVSFVTYATYWIRQRIMVFRRKNWGPLKVPREQIDRYRRIMRFCMQHAAQHGRQATLDEIVSGTQLTLEQLLAAIVVGAVKPKACDLLSHDEVDRIEAGLGGFLPPDHDAALDRVTFLPSLLLALAPQQRRVIRLKFGLDPEYWGYECNGEEIGAIIGFTRERVRQLGDEALARLQKLAQRSTPPKPYYPWEGDEARAQEALTRLSPEDRELYRLVVEQGFSTAALAKRLQIDAREVRKEFQRIIAVMERGDAGSTTAKT